MPPAPDPVESFVERADFLMKSDRPGQALEELRKAVALDPENAVIRALLASCLDRLNRTDEAEREARDAVRFAPGWHGGYMVLAEALLSKRRDADALEAAREARRIEPEDANVLDVLGAVHLYRREWAEALTAAEKALAHDPDLPSAAHTRTVALTHLGRGGEAHAAAEATLAQHPEAAVAHASKGWAALHAGNVSEARHCFLEALRLSPELEWARYGLLETLRARNLPYRLLLRYTLWTERLSEQGMLALFLLVGLPVAAYLKIVWDAPGFVPHMAAFVAGIAAVFYVPAAVRSLFDLVLLLHPLGRHALTRPQKLAGLVTACLLLLGTALLCAAAVRDDVHLLYAGVITAGLIVPASGAFEVPSGAGRAFLLAYTLLLGALVMLGIAGPARYSITLLGEAALGVFFSHWLVAAAAKCAGTA